VKHEKVPRLSASADHTSPMSLNRYLIHNDTTLDEFKTFLP
jgi:hypothetical protein